MSHTVKVNIEMKNLEAAAVAGRLCGAQVLGMGTHRLFDGNKTGLGIQFKGWRYPVVLHEDGTVSYDDYNGVWGNKSDLDTMKEFYAQAVIQTECDKLGWYHETSTTGEMTIHHPEGGTITVSKSGTIEANGFVGSSCAAATAPLEAALGTKFSESIKPEFTQTRLGQGQGEE